MKKEYIVAVRRTHRVYVGHPSRWVERKRLRFWNGNETVEDLEKAHRWPTHRKAKRAASCVWKGHGETQVIEVHSDEMADIYMEEVL